MYKATCSNKMNLSERYKELRRTIKNSSGDTISIKDFSEQIQLATSRISELENGKREMSLTELKAYHNFFHVSFEYLLGETDIKSVNENIQTACKVTGLSEIAVCNLLDLKCEKYSIQEVLNHLLEELTSVKECDNND
ncbi:MAG: helix-turn-helix domain-containing protein [Ruminococcus sp.]|nr:helix-turn-helix domain-containing protein [Ruminococcus sp.]